MMSETTRLLAEMQSVLLRKNAHYQKYLTLDEQYKLMLAELIKVEQLEVIKCQTE